MISSTGMVITALQLSGDLITVMNRDLDDVADHFAQGVPTTFPLYTGISSPLE